MKRKIVTIGCMVGLLAFATTGCQNDDVLVDNNNEETTNLQQCSLCEVVKECGTYTVDGLDYIVCDDCYNEFQHGMGLIDDYNMGDTLENYMVSIKEQSDNIKVYLENEAMTQTDMNIKSQELYKLWDDALNYLWSEVKNTVSEEEYTKLLEEQRLWIADKEKKVEEAGQKFEGGSIYPLIVNGEAAKLTEERVYELYELLK